MRRLSLPTAACLVSFSLLGCAADGGGGDRGTNAPAPAPAPGSRAEGSAQIRLTPAEAKKVGDQIWKNECGGTVAGLTSWNSGETFASLGIGHFIWYPPGQEGPFEESFPPLLAYLRARGVSLPGWLDPRADCPWRTREQFSAAAGSPQMRELRGILQNTIPLQVEFIARRLEASLPKMLAAAPAAQRGAIRERFYAVAAAPQGVYALMDYVNFKGEGTNPSERYKGQGWGLAQVLGDMRPTPKGAPAVREFAAAADRMLTRRVQNAPKDESRWLAGWRNRLKTYAP